MRKIGFALTSMLVVVGCKSKDAGSPVDQILEIGIQAEQDLAEIATKQSESKDLSEIVELGKQEKIVRDSATSRINQLLGGKGERLPVAVAPCTDTLPIVCGNGSIGIPDFHKGEFKINLQISSTQKKPLPEGSYFQISVLDAQGKVLASKDGSVVDSLKIGDSLYAGGMFKAVDIRGMASVSAR